MTFRERVEYWVKKYKLPYEAYEEIAEAMDEAGRAKAEELAEEE